MGGGGDLVDRNGLARAFRAFRVCHRGGGPAGRRGGAAGGQVEEPHVLVDALESAVHGGQAVLELLRAADPGGVDVGADVAGAMKVVGGRFRDRAGGVDRVLERLQTRHQAVALFADGQVPCPRDRFAGLVEVAAQRLDGP